jgi:membrane associated rhomboid family serine protease
MLIPIGTNVVHKRYPFITYAIIGLNLLVFAVEWAVQRSGGIDASNSIVSTLDATMHQGALSSTDFHILNLITYQFLHAGWMHILGNMIFLLPFGKAVEDRMGHTGFALFYLGCGAFSGGIHALLSTTNVIGASGSVCGVTAAFLVLAPKTTIKVVLVFFIIGVYHVPSMLLVLFFVLFDVFSLLASKVGANAQNTAWFAHLGGYLFGFVITILLLQLRIISSTQFDFTEMIKQARRRRNYRKLVNKTNPSPVLSSAKLDSNMLLRASISETVAMGDVSAAADKYLGSFESHPKLKLNKQTQSNIANALFQAGRIEDGVIVYERYLEEHPSADDITEVALLLVAKYTRNLNNKERAQELLNQFSDSFSTVHKDLVDTLTNELSI